MKSKGQQHPPSRCAFCENPSRTKEHFWPQWLDKVMPPRTEFDTHPQTNLLVELGPDGTPTLKDIKTKVRQGHARTRRLKILCKACNGGWLSGIQDQTKDLIVSMMKGYERTLDIDDRKSIARWLAMTAMTSEFSHPPTRAIPRWQREAFKANMTPPAGWYMWAGRYAGTEWDTRFRHIGAKSFNPDIAESPPLTNNTHTTAFVLGEMVLFVLGSLDIDFINRPEEFVRSFGDAYGVASIWPLGQTDIVWRSLNPLTDADVDEMANMLVEIMVRPPAT